MATIDSLQDSVNTLTSSTTALLDEVNVSKATLTNSKDLAEAAATSATTQAANAASSASAASSSASSASASASAASASAASASAIVTGVATGMPSVRPSLNLDFVNSKTVDPRISFTRSTTATYYDGKTTAKAEENVLPRSELFNDGAWTDAGLLRQADMAVAPNGTTTADHMLVEASNSAHRVYQNHAGYMGTDTHVTISVYAKANGYNFLSLNTGGAQGSVVFNLSTGVVDQVDGTVTSYGITDVGNGWYRCHLTDTSYTGTQPIFSVVSQASATLDTFGSEVFLGDGVSGIYLWGAQMENRDSLTAYTPTTTSPITNYIPVLQTAAINEPRLDHDPVTGEAKGLLIEESRTNLFTNSTSFGLWANPQFVQQSVAIAPDGTKNASIIEGSDITVGTVNIVQGVSGSTTYTFSAYVKRLYEDETVTLRIYDGSTGGVTNQSIVLTDEWQRVSVTRTSGSATSQYRVYIYSSAGKAFLTWGNQLEVGSFPTSYIPTSGASVTRANDYAALPMDLSWYNISSGTFFVDAISYDTSAGNAYGRIGQLFAVDGGFSSSVYRPSIAREENWDLAVQGQSYGGADTAFGMRINDIYTLNTPMKAAFTNNPMGYPQLAGNGQVDTFNILQDQTIDYVGRSITFMKNYDGYSVGHIRKFSFFPSVLPDSELMALTAS